MATFDDYNSRSEFCLPVALLIKFLASLTSPYHRSGFYLPVALLIKFLASLISPYHRSGFCLHVALIKFLASFTSPSHNCSLFLSGGSQSHSPSSEKTPIILKLSPSQHISQQPQAGLEAVEDLDLDVEHNFWAEAPTQDLLAVAFAEEVQVNSHPDGPPLLQQNQIPPTFLPRSH